jgi:diacylglycerol kinase (ATP)
MNDCCALIVNPTSGKYRESLVRSVMERLAAGGLSPQLHLTRSAEEPPLVARGLCQEYDNPLVIAAGGDGTVNGVVNGLAPGRATLAVLPLGTANVLAKEIGVKSVDEAVDRIVRGQTRSIAAGAVTAGERRKYFLLMAGIGFDGRVVGSTRGREKKILKQGAYLLAALRCLIAWEREEIEVRTEQESFACHSLVVCNAADYGGRFRLAPDTDLFTPGFSLVGVTSGKRSAFFRLALATVTGRQSVEKEVRRLRADRIEISGSKPIQIDGDEFGSCPVIIETVPAFARLVV